MSEIGGSSQTEPGGHRQQDLYWKQLVELKALSVFIRRYRDQQALWVKRIGVVKGVAASSTIPGWVFFQEYVWVWGIIVGAAQLADAIKDAIPHAKRHKSAAELAIVLERLFVDAQFEWENIFTGKFRDDEIMVRRRQLARRQLDAEKAHFPGGLTPDAKLGELQASDYFLRTYGAEEA
jgi:hypothetical protein